MRDTIACARTASCSGALRRPISAETTPARYASIGSRSTTVTPLPALSAVIVPRYGRPFTWTRLFESGEVISSASEGELPPPPGPTTATPTPATVIRHCSPAGISASRAPEGSLTLRPAAPAIAADGAATARPTRIIGSAGVWPGDSPSGIGPGSGVGPGGAAVGVQLATATATTAATAATELPQRLRR